ncbi:pentapeptide repeat-containing protein [Amycolatopsis benzoatilytica]|uniref:pentapeptide repeat-containing protein n=1 Tax=Amycolatopsis benzoatilytica TaxID=346045 RepID=UPI0003738E65|nr:pentapeptide repeat-containing protein [Amycolatopsis benzoatilytica]
MIFTYCRIRSVVCRKTKFHESATFRGTEFRTKTDFSEAAFRHRADFRGVAFGGERDASRGAKFEQRAEFDGDSTVRLGGALAKPGHRRDWPSAWTEEPGSDGWLRLVPR